MWVLYNLKRKINNLEWVPTATTLILLNLCKWIRTMTKPKWQENDVICLNKQNRVIVFSALVQNNFNITKRTTKPCMIPSAYVDALINIWQMQKQIVHKTLRHNMGETQNIPFQKRSTYRQGSNPDFESAPKKMKTKTDIWIFVAEEQKSMFYNKDSPKKQLTIPIRFSRQSITELLVAAEQTANFLPYNNEQKKGITVS